MRDLTTRESLQPLVGTTSESADLDFKETLDLSQEKIEIEVAKDIAALANVLGGHVLIGVSTEMNRMRCTGFHGIDKQRATKITKVFEESVKQGSGDEQQSRRNHEPITRIALGGLARISTFGYVWTHCG